MPRVAKNSLQVCNYVTELPNGMKVLMITDDPEDIESIPDGVEKISCIKINVGNFDLNLNLGNKFSRRSR